MTSSSGLQAYDLYLPDICRDLVKIRQGELQSERDQVILFFLNFEQWLIQFEENSVGKIIIQQPILQSGETIEIIEFREIKISRVERLRR